MSNKKLNSDQDSNDFSEKSHLNPESKNAENKEETKDNRKKGLFSFRKPSDSKNEEKTVPEEEQDELIDSRLEGLQERHEKTQTRNRSKNVLGFETLLSDYDEDSSDPFLMEEKKKEQEKSSRNEQEESVQKAEPFKSDFPIYEMQETTSFYEDDSSENEEEEELYLRDLLEKPEEEPSPAEKPPVSPENIRRIKDKAANEEEEEDFAALRSSLWEKEGIETTEEKPEKKSQEYQGDEDNPFTIDVDDFSQIEEDFVVPENGVYQKFSPNPPEPEKEALEEEAEEEEFEDRSFFNIEKPQKPTGQSRDLFESLTETRESLLEGMQDEPERELERPVEQEEVISTADKSSQKKLWIFLSALFAILITFSLAVIFIFNKDKPAEISVVITPVPADEGIHPVGLRLPGGWYFLLQTGEIVNGKWEPQGCRMVIRHRGSASRGYPMDQTIGSLYSGAGTWP